MIQSQKTHYPPHHQQSSYDVDILFHSSCEELPQPRQYTQASKSLLYRGNVIAVGIPCFNEELTISKVIEDIHKFSHRLSYTSTITTPLIKLL